MGGCFGYFYLILAWGGRPYLMHYIRLDVTERKDYVFKVKSAESAWSQQFKFRAPANTGVAGPGLWLGYGCAVAVAVAVAVLWLCCDCAVT